MTEVKFNDWIEKNHSRFQSLTNVVVSIMSNLLAENRIDYLAISGRTKSKEDCIEKIKRKNYKNPPTQLTDVSGIRIIVYFERDVERVSEIVERSFNVDSDNSLNKDELLSSSEMGYRSVHYVCDLGDPRSKLPEFRSLEGLRFEFQIRTVLQHAWAELSHERKYKLAGSLPKTLERKIFLLAGLLETADKGFDTLANEIDVYMDQVYQSSARGNLEIELNSLSIDQFVKQWCDSQGVVLYNLHRSKDLSELVDELDQFGIKNLMELKELIPDDYARNLDESEPTIFGIVRDWMIISDCEKFIENVQINWVLGIEDLDLYQKYLTKNQISFLVKNIGLETDFEESQQ